MAELLFFARVTHVSAGRCYGCCGCLCGTVASKQRTLQLELLKDEQKECTKQLEKASKVCRCVRVRERVCVCACVRVRACNRRLFVGLRVCCDVICCCMSVLFARSDWKKHVRERAPDLVAVLESIEKDLKGTPSASLTQRHKDDGTDDGPADSKRSCFFVHNHHTHTHTHTHTHARARAFFLLPNALYSTVAGLLFHLKVFHTCSHFQLAPI